MGGAHLDGNKALAKRLAPLSETLQHASVAAPLDGAFLFGDINCTIEPKDAARTLSTPMHSQSPTLSRVSQISTAQGKSQSKWSMVRRSVLVGARFAKLLTGEMNRARENAALKTVHSLKGEAQEVLPNQLRTHGGRVALQHLDGTPQSVELEGCGAIQTLELMPMPAGSFPTYPLCNVDNATFRSHLSLHACMVYSA